MADNAFIKIGTALLKHQVKKLVGEETLGVISEELADIGGDKLNELLGDKSTIEQLEKAAKTAEQCFHDSIGDHELEQWMASLPIGELPKVTEAVEKLPTSPDEKELEEAIRLAVQGWRKLSPEQVDNAVNLFLSCLRSALLPVEKQTLMVIGRSVLRTEDKVDLLLRWFEQYIITGKPVEVKQLNPEPVDTWCLAHPYPMPPNFTGRVEERKMLADWLNKDNDNRLFILRALGGFGKSALTWHWLTHDVDSNDWKKVVFWSFYEGDASFEHFIEETLKYLNLEVPQGGRPQVEKLLNALQSQKVLLIMDGFERILRLYANMNAAYQSDEEQQIEENQLGCVNINAEIFLQKVCSLPNIKSKVLMTTRLTPRDVKTHDELLQGCFEKELKEMEKTDAVDFFHAQGIQGIRSEIETACASYGYHPLSLRILARYIIRDFNNPNDIVVAQKLRIDGDIKSQRHHVLEVAYNSLMKQEQSSLNTIACCRSPIDFKTLETIIENKDSLNSDLHNLVDCGLLNFDEKNKKFDLHPIVRRYAYSRYEAEKRKKTHLEIATLYAGVVPTTNTNIKNLNELAPLIELYYHLVKAKNFEQAYLLLNRRLVPSPLFYEFGAYDLALELVRELFLNGEDKPPVLIKPRGQSWLYNALANSYASIGKPQQAIYFFMKSAEIDKYDSDNLGVDLGNAAEQQTAIGALKEAEANASHRIDLAIERKNEFDQAIGRRELGMILLYRGEWNESETQFKSSLRLFTNEDLQPKSSTWGCRARRLLAMMRANSQSSLKTSRVAIKSASRSLELIGESSHRVERGYVLAHWILGATYRAGSHMTNSVHLLINAEEYLSKAISDCQRINSVEDEANILLDLARLRYDQKNYDEAKSLVDEALSITERCGYVLQGADVNLFLAQYALEQEKDKAKAKQYAEEALKLATCDGPPYYYKVAYEEAERFLEKL